MAPVRLEELLLEQDAEVVLGALGDPVASSEDLADLVLGEIDGLRARRLEVEPELFDGVDAVDVAGGGDGHEDEIVLVLTHHLALVLHDADDGEGRGADDEVGSEDRFGELELLDDLAADECHPGGALEIEIGEETALLHPVVRDLLVRRADAEQHGRVAPVSRSGLFAAIEDRVEEFEAGRLFHDGEPVVIGQRDLASGEIRILEVLSRKDHDVGHPDAFELGRDDVVEALDDGHHRDHRGDADDDPEHGQQRAHLVGPDGGQRDAEVVPDHDRASPPSRASVADDPAVEQSDGAAGVRGDVLLVGDQDDGVARSR